MAFALLVVVGLYVLRPIFWAPQPAARKRAVSQRAALEAEKEAILEQIRHLDFDFETGTILEAEHQLQRQQLVAAAAAVLQELDALAPAAPAAGGEVDEIELAIAQRRSERAAVDIEAAVAARRARPQAVASPARPSNGSGEQAAGRTFCPQCGQAIVSGDRFCAYCGHQLD